MRLLLEVCGDRAIGAYTRADGDRLRDTLRKLPNQYRKSEKDRDKPLAQIIAEADAAKSQRVSDKTLKRHFWAISRFFAFLIETGRLPRDSTIPAGDSPSRRPARLAGSAICGPAPN